MRLTNAPYFNWISNVGSLASYVNDIIDNPTKTIVGPFNLWLSSNLDNLYSDRYKRTENSIIAIQLLPLFKKHPLAWQTVQYLNLIEINNDTVLESFLQKWLDVVPDRLKIYIYNIRSILLH